MLGGTVAISALRHAERAAIIDERGTVTFEELDRRVNALANSWRERGLQGGAGVAILARNHRGFLEATFAAAKCGARVILLNTDFAGPQVREVASREGAVMIVHDDEYSEFVTDFNAPLGRYRAWTDAPADDTIEALIQSGDPAPPPKPAETAVVVILTSGTTGTPKGAQRETPKSLTPLGALFGRVPFRPREASVICAPLFHALGFALAVGAISLGSTTILRRRFEPALVLEDIERHRASGLVVVPVMLQRILDAYDEAPRNLSSLRIVFVSGSQLGGALAKRALDTLGEVIYNLYGSTEVAYASIATPADLRVAPESVGRPTRGTIVQILDPAGRPLEDGAVGRVFVGNAAQFEGYTGGGSKEMVGALMSTGDVGHFDASGRLYIDGRDDEMIVSGGENVFPREVEELLLRHPAIEEAAAVGVDDEQFGQRLRAFVVRRPATELSEDDVRDYVRANLARFKVPREVVFLEQLPRNPTGKVLKRELQAM
jgi:fatty-acyl-CoA synthase